MAVAVNTLFQEHGKPIETQWADALIKRVQPPDPQKHTIRTLTPEQVQQLVPTKHEAEVLRKYKKDLEVIDSGMIVPTVTASLRESLNFSEELLDQKGLYVFLIRDANSRVRWMSPFEAARALGFSMATTLPQEFKQAQRLVGNAISPYHAGLMLQYVGKVLKQRAGLNYEGTFREFLQRLDEQLGQFNESQLVVSHGSAFLCSPGDDDLLAEEAPIKRLRTDGSPKKSLDMSLVTQIDVATQQFHITLPGDVPESGESGIIYVSGRFFHLPHPCQLQQWNEWFHLHLPIT